MSEQLQLDADELELIEARRAKVAAEEDLKTKEAQAQYAGLRKQRKGKARAAVALAIKLEQEDEEGICSVNTHLETIEHSRGDFEIEVTEVTFSVDGNEHALVIEEHITYPGRGYFSRNNNGMKYHLYGCYNDYKHKWYKNPKALLKAIVELNDVAVKERQQEAVKLSLKDRAIAEMKNRYPTLEHDFEAEYAFGAPRQRHYKPNRIIVRSDIGTYTFTYFERDDKIIFNVYGRTFGREVEDQVCKLVLGEPTE